MAYTQTLAATLVLLIFILITLVLNEGVYSNTDVNVRLDWDSYTNKTLAPQEQDCTWSRGELSIERFTTGDDAAREFLYGGFSARGGTISAIVLGIGAFVIAIVVGDIDTEMEAKYEEGSWFHRGNTKAFVTGVIFRLLVVGTALSMTISSVCTLGALLYQGYVPSAGLDFGVEDANPRELPKACSDLDDNVVHRSDSLKASLFFSIASVFFVSVMSYYVHYDKKASKEV